MSAQHPAWKESAAKEGGSQNPFETPYGPTPSCFSADDQVRMFTRGALRRDLNHLQTCNFCPQQVERFRTVVMAKEKAAWMPALLFVDQTQPCTVNVGLSTLAPVKILVLAPQEFATGIDPSSIRLSGALEGLHCDLLPTSSSRFVEVLCHAKPSRDLLRSLKKHSPVEVGIQLEAQWKDQSKPMVLANARLAFIDELG